MNCLPTPATKYRCSVGFSSVVAKSATRTHSDSSGHESWLQEWSTPLDGAVLGVRRHSKASDGMLEHCGDSLAQRGRMSGLVLSETCSPGDWHQVLGMQRMVLRETPPARRSGACDSSGTPMALTP